ncbi:MAG: ribonuclease R [Desulfuromonadales bacterium]|nr:ribonuclease R [Desulfuromonadales bacterium]
MKKRKVSVKKIAVKSLSAKSGRGEKTISGKLCVHKDGYGFVTPDRGGDDVFIPAKCLKNSLHGDQVSVRVCNRRGNGKCEGEIVETLKHEYEKVVGIFENRRGFSVVRPMEQKLGEVFIPKDGLSDAKSGEVVVAKITAYPDQRTPLTGKIVEVLGNPEDPEVEVLSIIRKFDLPYEFQETTLKEARSIGQAVNDSDVAGRKDLRDILTVTIDGETAKDFDDAVSVRAEKEGIRLWVSIADVAHYVKPGSPIDIEAYLRGTSVYFPDRCIPMLPEELSNGICSLNPNVDRLTMTAEMLFNMKGEMVSSSFYPAVIRSNARLTYTIVSKIVEHNDPEAVKEYNELVPDLMVMKDLALILIDVRKERGSIDFDLPEPEIIIGANGATEGIVRAERNLAHKIIESFMLAANEAVAAYITKLDIPMLYRIHEPPSQEKLAALGEFLLPLGYKLESDNGVVTSKNIQKLLKEMEGAPEERLVNRLLLRSMKQARYSAENLGHFGLGTDCYTHFTSPIRRYPDLVVHRILKWTLQKGAGFNAKSLPFPGFPASLNDIADHTSKRERVAMEAEREVVDLKKVQFMSDKVGEEFDGYIDGVTSFGIFVELEEFFVEGMIHISTLPRDFYRYIESLHVLEGERSGVKFRIGDPIRVVVAGVNIEQRQIEFTIAGMKPADNGEGEYAHKPIKGKKPEGWKNGAGDVKRGSLRKSGGKKRGRRVRH